MRESLVSSRPSPWDMHQSLLVAVLMHHGGSMDLPTDVFESDTLGDRRGAQHAVRLTPLASGLLRLSVVVLPPGVDDVGLGLRDV